MMPRSNALGLLALAVGITLSGCGGNSGGSGAAASDGLVISIVAS
jgi:hypothetical protein